MRWQEQILSCVDRYMKLFEKRKSKTFFVFAVILLIIFIIFLSVQNRNPQPSDEEMIEYFYAHKSEIEEIVKRYREFPEPVATHYRWAEEPSTNELLKKAGVKDLTNNGWPIFYPDPYSPQSIAKLKAAEKIGDYEESIRHGLIRVSLARPDYFSAGTKYGILIKSLYYFPEEPFIENNWLFVPDSSGTPKKFYEVTSSLNWPIDTLVTCQLRKVEPKWFICLCRSGAGHS